MRAKKGQGTRAQGILISNGHVAKDRIGLPMSQDVEQPKAVSMHGSAPLELDHVESSRVSLNFGLDTT